MRWEDERYVRIYTRDTVDWLGLSFIAQGLFCLILRKVDRAGLLKLGKPGKRGVAIVIGFAGEWSRLEAALDELLADGCVQLRGEHLVVPNFIDAQEAPQTDAQRKRESRARDRDLAAAAVVLGEDAQVSRSTTKPDKKSENVTDGHETGQNVTSGHVASQVVTPSLAVPSQPAVEATAAAASGVNDDPPRPRLTVVDETGIPPAASVHPLVAAFRSALADRIGVPADWLRVASAERVATVRDDLERELARVGVAAALEPCAEAAAREQRAKGRKPQHLAFYLRIIQDMTPAGGEAAPGPRRQVVVGFDAAGSPILGEGSR